MMLQSELKTLQKLGSFYRKIDYLSLFPVSDMVELAKTYAGTREE